MKFFRRLATALSPSWLVWLEGFMERGIVNDDVHLSGAQGVAAFWGVASCS